MHRQDPSASSKKTKAKKRNRDKESSVLEVSVSEDAPPRKKRRTYAQKEAEAIDFVRENPLVPREYSSADTTHLSKNEHNRYLPPSRKIGHAVIKEGSDTVFQFNIPEGEDDAPVIRPLKDIEAIVRKGKTFYRARTPDFNTKMFATRFLNGELDGEKFTIANFSPMRVDSKYPEPFWGEEDRELALFKKKMPEAEKKDHDRLVRDIEKKGLHTKGGEWLKIESASVQTRDNIDARHVDQNRVMHESAVEAFKAFLENWEEAVTPDMKGIFERSIKAPLRNAFYSQWRPEWLHAYGHSLTPISFDPQKKENLGAAPKWANTEMMVLERIVKWYALNRPEAKTEIRPFFEMILDSELIRKIDFAIKIEDNGHLLLLEQHLDPLKKHQLFRKPTDVMQGTAIAYSMLNEIAPASEAKLKTDNEKKLPAANKEVPKGSTLAAMKKTPEHAVASFNMEPKNKFSVKESAFPTNMRVQDSVVQIYTTAQEADYDEPWKGASQKTWHGSGVVIEQDGKKYIVTNAHVAENAVNMRVRFANDRTKKFQAKCICFSPQSDLALLEINNPEFQKRAIPAQLGSMVSLQQGVETVGFPMGGNEVNISRGIVSRIEVGNYCESDMDMLRVGVDAAINPGNSGGPVFSDGKVVGIAFQGYDRQGLGFMIPMPIVHHFLTEAFSGKPYRGYPILPLVRQTLENPAQRKYYGLSENQTGVRIKRIDKLSDAFGKLQIDDVLLEIDGLSISNEGTVDIPGIGNVIDMLHVTHSKYIDDTVRIKLLRKDKEKNKFNVFEVDVKLDTIPCDTTMVPTKEFFKMPTYYVNSGISFTVLTPNYIEGRGADFEEIIDRNSGASIMEATKDQPDDRYVVINDVLDCETTEGYEHALNSLVKEVNGKEIRNIHDVIAAMDNFTGEFHTVMTTSNEAIVVKNLSRQENDQLLDRYEIHADRSKDLRNLPPVDSMDIDELSTPAPIVKPIPVRFNSALNLFGKLSASPVQNKLALSDAELLPDFDGESSESDEKTQALTAADLPGFKKWQGKINQMANQFSAAEWQAYENGDLVDDEDDEDFEDGLASENISEESSESSEVQDAKKRVNNVSLFKPVTKRKSDEDEKEKSYKNVKR